MRQLTFIRIKLSYKDYSTIKYGSIQNLVSKTNDFWSELTNNHYLHAELEYRFLCGFTLIHIHSAWCVRVYVRGFIANDICYRNVKSMIIHTFEIYLQCKRI